MRKTNKTARTDLFTYKFIPSHRPSEKIMIVLHGRGDSIRPFKNFDDELLVKDMNYLLINAHRRFLRGWSWYAEPPSQRESLGRVRAQMFRLIAELEAQGWQHENMYFLGFSQGGLVSADLGLHYPKKLGGIIGISSYFHFFPRWRHTLTSKARRTPWLFTHGRQDDVLSIQSTEFGIQKLKSAGLDVEWLALDKKHVFNEKDFPLIREWLRVRPHQR